MQCAPAIRNTYAIIHHILDIASEFREHHRLHICIIGYHVYFLFNFWVIGRKPSENANITKNPIVRQSRQEKSLGERIDRKNRVVLFQVGRHRVRHIEKILFTQSLFRQRQHILGHRQRSVDPMGAGRPDHLFRLLRTVSEKPIDRGRAAIPEKESLSSTRAAGDISSFNAKSYAAQ